MALTGREVAPVEALIVIQTYWLNGLIDGGQIDLYEAMDYLDTLTIDGGTL